MSRLKLGSVSVDITNEQKILFPGQKYSKADVIAYYKFIAPYMLPHMKNRPLTMQRFPEGITGQGFYHKNAPDYFPDWIKRIAVPKIDGSLVHYVICNNTATLIYLANAGCLVPHLWLSTTQHLDYPDVLIFDLDPSRNNDFKTVIHGAKQLKKLLETIGLVPFVKSTGSRGLHVTVPIKPTVPYELVGHFARAIADYLVQKHPDKFTTELAKKKRGGKVFIDWLRNGFGATAVAPYAIRAKPEAPIAVPLAWSELDNPQLTPTYYTFANITQRIKKMGDIWQDMQSCAGSLSKSIHLFNELKNHSKITN